MEINKIYIGDCLELMPKLIDDKSVDMIFCDLPYGTTKCDWDSVIPLDKHIYIGDKFLYEEEFLIKKFKEGLSYLDAINIFKLESKDGLWQHYERIIKDNGVILLFAQTPFDKELGKSNKKLLRYEWIWEKGNATGHLNAKKMPMKAHENILVFYKNLPIYNPQKTSGHNRKVSKSEHKINCKESNLYNKGQILTTYDSTERYPRSVQVFASDKQKCKLHPTQKPLSLIEYMILTYTNAGDLILDNTCGSGTTGLGAKNLGRNFIMMEQDPKYYEIACKRTLT